MGEESENGNGRKGLLVTREGEARERSLRQLDRPPEESFSEGSSEPETECAALNHGRKHTKHCSCLGWIKNANPAAADLSLVYT